MAGRSDFKRAAHLEYVRPRGGDAAAKEPWRMALSYLMASGMAGSLNCLKERIGGKAEIVEEMIRKGVNSPYTSSMGRLFDAAASLLGVRDEITFEAQASIELESIADRHETGFYEFSISGAEPLRIDAANLIKGMVRDIESGVPKETIAGRFHNSIARVTAHVASMLRKSTGIKDVVLTGGVFQNSLLSDLASDSLAEAGFKVYMNEKIRRTTAACPSARLLSPGKK